MCQILSLGFLNKQLLYSNYVLRVTALLKYLDFWPFLHLHCFHNTMITIITRIHLIILEYSRWFLLPVIPEILLAYAYSEGQMPYVRQTYVAYVKFSPYILWKIAMMNSCLISSTIIGKWFHVNSSCKTPPTLEGSRWANILIGVSVVSQKAVANICTLK